MQIGFYQFVILLKTSQNSSNSPCSIDKNQSLQEYMNNLNSISYEDLEIALKQIEYGNDIIRKWLIDNNGLEVT